MTFIKRFQYLVLSIVIVSSINANCTLDVYAASYPNDYRYWSQNQSDYAGVRDYGCWIVAMARMLYEMGIDQSPSFNPDRFAEWEVANGRIANYNHVGQLGDGGEAPVIYANQKGKELTYFGNNWEVSSNQFWFNINAGYWTIVKVSSGGGYHYILIDNATSKSTGQLYIYESSSDGYYTGPRLLSAYGSWVGSYVYKYEPAPTNGTLDVNGRLDGANNGGLGDFGTCDVYINGSRVADDVTDYCTAWPAGTSYEVKDIKAKSGYSYDGSGSYSGTIASGAVADVRLIYSSCKLDVNGMLDDTLSGNLGNYGTFDVYINGSIVADDVNDYCALAPKGASYEIKDIKETYGHIFEKVITGSLTGTIGAGTKTVVLGLYTPGIPIGDWTYCDVLPKNITSDYCDIMYQYTETTTAASSPGSGWEKKEGSGTTRYENDGGVYDSDFELSTSDTRVYVGSYYYHYCGASTGVNVEHYNDGTHTDYHVAGDVNSFYVSGGPYADDHDSRYLAYQIRWVSGQWADGLATCAGGRSAIWYRRYQYQNKKAVTYFTWVKKSAWLPQPSGSGTPSQYRYRLKDTGVPEISAVKVAEITPYGYTIVCQASDDTGIMKMTASTWTDTETEANAKVNETVPETMAGSVQMTVTIPVTDHGNERDVNYNTRITVYDKVGNTTEYTEEDIKVYIATLIRSARKLDLPADLQEIEEGAFEGSIGFGEVMIPDGTGKIGSRAFADCSRLVFVSIPDSVSEISDDAFDGSSNTVILCSADSEAEAFAKRNGIPYFTDIEAD